MWWWVISLFYDFCCFQCVTHCMLPLTSLWTDVLYIYIIYFCARFLLVLQCIYSVAGGSWMCHWIPCCKNWASKPLLIRWVAFSVCLPEELSVMSSPCPCCILYCCYNYMLQQLTTDMDQEYVAEILCPSTDVMGQSCNKPLYYQQKFCSDCGCKVNPSWFLKQATSSQVDVCTGIDEDGNVCGWQLDSAVKFCSNCGTRSKFSFCRHFCWCWHYCIC